MWHGSGEGEGVRPLRMGHIPKSEGSCCVDMTREKEDELWLRV